MFEKRFKLALPVVNWKLFIYFPELLSGHLPAQTHSKCFLHSPVLQSCNMNGRVLLKSRAGVVRKGSLL